MKIICTQENLRTGLSTVSRIITSSNTLPILNNLLLKTENGLLKVSSTNLEISIHTIVRCKVEDPGEVCVPAKIFSDLVNTLPNRNITLTAGEGVLKVEVEKHSASVKTLPSDDFPSIPAVDSGNKITFASSVLKGSLEEVVFAASHNETQPEISGVLIKPAKTGCTFVATDRYRLAERKLSMSAPDTGQVIVPLRTSLEIIKSLASGPETVDMVLGENQILFDVGDTQIISRVIDGQYPDYEQIIPNQFGTTVYINRLELLGALKTSSIFSQGSNSVRLEVDESGSQIIISSGSQDVGESTVAVAAEISGPGVSVLFNHRYILDMLNASSAERMLVKINSDSLPVVFSEDNNSEYLYLVMPIKN